MKLTTQTFMLPVTLVYVLCFCFFGCGADEEVSPSDTLLPTGADLEQLIAQALDMDKLQTRGPSGEELFYKPNQETPYTGWVKDHYDNEDEDLRILAQVINGKFHGAWTEWYGNGQKETEGTYKNGERDGAWTFWWENGQKETEGTYKEGKKDGMWTEWHGNGQKETEGTYKEGKKDGMWTEWYRNGQKKAKGTYKEGKKDGMWTEWYEENDEKNEKWAEGTYKNGRRDGVWTTWTQDGQQRRVRWWEIGEIDLPHLHPAVSIE